MHLIPVRMLAFLQSALSEKNGLWPFLVSILILQ
jgi:hypothetical protein